MEEIKKWFIGLTSMQVLGLGILNYFICMFILFFCLYGLKADIAVSFILGILPSAYFFYLGQIRKTHILSKLVKEKEQISRNYELAKDKLRQQPSDNKLREKALQSGREYYKSLRNGQLSIYDEQAINNDLAAVAPVSQANNTLQSNIDKADENNQSDIVAKLEKLKQLKDKGMITESEFEAKKKDLINKM